MYSWIRWLVFYYDNWFQDEEEWKDFEEEKKDYSNLKIQNLNITEGGSGEDGQDDEEEGEGELEENEVGEMVPKKKVPNGPWKVVAPVEVEQPGMSLQCGNFSNFLLKVHVHYKWLVLKEKPQICKLVVSFQNLFGKKNLLKHLEVGVALWKVVMFHPH